MVQAEIICAGAALIDILTMVYGSSIVATGEMKMAAGGAPANVAVGLARLGTKSGFLGRVGDDFFGHHLKEVLDTNGVDTSHLIMDPRIHTGLAFVSWDSLGDATYLFYRQPSADTMLSPEDIDQNYLAGARVLQFGSLLLATEPSASATFQALKIATEAGLLLSYDLNLRLSFWPYEEHSLATVNQPLAYANIIKIHRH